MKKITLTLLVLLLFTTSCVVNVESDYDNYIRDCIRQRSMNIEDCQREFGQREFVGVQKEIIQINREFKPIYFKDNQNMNCYEENFTQINYGEATIFHYVPSNVSFFLSIYEDGRILTEEAENKDYVKLITYPQPHIELIYSLNGEYLCDFDFLLKVNSTSKGFTEDYTCHLFSIMKRDKYSIPKEYQQMRQDIFNEVRNCLLR